MVPMTNYSPCGFLYGPVAIREADGSQASSADFYLEDDGERLPDGSLIDGPDGELHVDRPFREEEGEIGSSQSLVSVYGKPISAERAAALLPPGDSGLIWHAELCTDAWKHPQHTDKDGKIRPRRSILPVLSRDFFSSLVKTADGRWIFSGTLNGWPALTLLELRSITCGWPSWHVVFQRGMTPFFARFSQDFFLVAVGVGCLIRLTCLQIGRKHTEGCRA